MSVRVEKLISEYPQMVSQKKCLAYQVAHFRGLSPEDVITSMYTAHHEGERVQTSGTSDKTAQIALNYESRMERLNREWYERWRNAPPGTDFEAFRREAFQSCPGLTQLWQQPFQAKYTTANGFLLIQFSTGEDGTCVRGFIVEK